MPYASPQEEILDLVEWGDFNDFNVADLIREWNNCEHCQVAQDGNVHVHLPQSPHFLSADALLEFLNWNCARHAQHLLFGASLRFAEACESISEIDVAIAGMADLSDCAAWDITPSEWRQSLHCAKRMLEQA
jgi:hypothetical protein